MIYITHILLIMAAIWDIKKMEVPLTISVMLYLVHTCELLSSNYWKIDLGRDKIMGIHVRCVIRQLTKGMEYTDSSHWNDIFQNVF